MVPNTRLDDSGKYDPSTTANGASYRKVQGMFGWLQQCTRPDLSFAHRETGRCQEAPGHLAWAVQKHKLKYMSATRHVGITYRRSAGPGICIYSDSDFANRTTDRKSVEGYVMLCAGGAVSWGSRVQRHLADSSCMAEYMAACSATKHAMWTKNMLTALKLWPAHAGPIPLYVDNESAIKTALKEGTTTRNKHWEVQYHMVRQQQQQGLVQLLHVPSKQNLADPLTKAVGSEALAYFRESVGMHGKVLAQPTQEELAAESVQLAMQAARLADAAAQLAI